MDDKHQSSRSSIDVIIQSFQLASGPKKMIQKKKPSPRSKAQKTAPFNETMVFLGKGPDFPLPSDNGWYVYIYKYMYGLQCGLVVLEKKSIKLTIFELVVNSYWPMKIPFLHMVLPDSLNRNWFISDSNGFKTTINSGW